MTNQELIDQLLKMPRDLPVILSKDGEGNNVRLVSDVVEGHYDENDMIPLHPDDVDDESKPAVIIWPNF
jgi:hypothetical protein